MEGLTNVFIDVCWVIRYMLFNPGNISTGGLDYRIQLSISTVFFQCSRSSHPGNIPVVFTEECHPHLDQFGTLRTNQMQVLVKNVPKIFPIKVLWVTIQLTIGHLACWFTVLVDLSPNGPKTGTSPLG